MAAHIDDGRVQLLTRTGLDWTDKYPSAIAALANLNIKTAYIDGELWGVDEAGLPTFAHTQAASDGQRNVGSATRHCPSHLTHILKTMTTTLRDDYLRAC
jgi:ATP-dependent DNA ligase